MHDDGSQLLVGARSMLVWIVREAENRHTTLTPELVTAGLPAPQNDKCGLPCLLFSLVIEDGQHRIAWYVPSQESRLPADWKCRGTSYREKTVPGDGSAGIGSTGAGPVGREVNGRRRNEAVACRCGDARQSGQAIGCRVRNRSGTVPKSRDAQGYPMGEWGLGSDSGNAAQATKPATEERCCGKGLARRIRSRVGNNGGSRSQVLIVSACQCRSPYNFVPAGYPFPPAPGCPFC